MNSERVLEAAAFSYLERGVSVIPIDPSTKKPFIKWKEYQHGLPTEEDVISWQRRASELRIGADRVRLAAITGQLSGFVIVDCDRPEAVEACKAAGVWSPVRVRTKNGLHLYFRHPKDREYRPRVGSNSKGIDWPKLDGLDFRGDGSYALVPPSANYEWDVDPGFEIDDPSDWPEWKGWPMDAPLIEGKEISFDALDLSAVAIKNAITVWDATRAYVAARFPGTHLIPSGQGNGRNQRVLSYAAEQILYGFWGDALDERVCAFMDHFFVERLEESAWKATCRSVETMERANHPERFTDDGRYLAPYAGQETSHEAEDEPQQADASEEVDGLIDAADIRTALDGVEEEYFVRPIIPKGQVIQVVGYSGAGKSTFVQLLIHAITIQRKTFGPFEIESGGNILYLNYEEGRQTLRERSEEAVSLLGDFPKNSPYQTTIYAASLSKEEEINLNTKEGLKRLGRMIKRCKPEIVVIDTVRSGWPGLDENDATAWAPINRVCLRLRNLGVSVILLHHRNKPSKDGLGSYAGNTNQITVVETQVYVTQVYRDEDTAKAKGGKWDGEYAKPVYPQLEMRWGQNHVDWQIEYVMEIEFGKVRNWTDDHDNRQWIGLATNIHTDKQQLIALPSSKQIAVSMYHQNRSIAEICQTVHRRRKTVERWLAPHVIKPGGRPTP